MVDAYFQPLSVCHGDQPEALQTLPTLPDVLSHAAQTRQGIVYLHSDGTEHSQPYEQLQQRALQILVGMSQAGTQAGDRVVLQILEPAEFLAGIWACWLGGLVAVPIAVPSSYTEETNKARQLRSILEFVNASLVLTSPELEATVRAFTGWGNRVVSLAEFEPRHSNRAGDSSQGKDLDAPIVQLPNAEQLALILFTSGSTGKPKGVKLTAKNLLGSAYGMATVNRLTDRSITLNWMPLDHVASLVMFHLTEVYLGCQQIHVANDYILSNPLRWIDAIDRFRVTATWAPNFAYGLVNARSSEMAQRRWDLSCVQWMGNGAEAVVGRTTRTFLQLLAPYGLADTAVSPGYGMSETTSGIVHSHRFSCANTKDDDPFVEVGTPIPGVSLRIVDDQQQIVPEGTIGLLQVQGLTITSGYDGAPDLTAAAFTPDGWFDTGDLGFLQAGRLTITGRQKDAIILNGANVYSHEIEAVVEELASIEVSYTAACAVRRAEETTDRLVIFLHPVGWDTDPDLDLRLLVKIVRRQVMTRLGISPDAVIPVARSSIPKTALGKIQRSELSRQFQAGEFDEQVARIADLFRQPVDSVQPRSPIEQQLQEIWCSVLGLDHIGVDDHFFELGGNSLLLLQVLHHLQQQGYPVSAVNLFQYATIATLAEFLSQSQASQSQHSSDTPSPVNPAVWQGQQRARRRQQVSSTGIAVIGMACRFPGAASPEQFWQNLCEGVESITFFADEELLAAGVEPSLLQHPNYVKASPVLDRIEWFDAEFFGYSPREAELLDPQQRLMLECAWEALEDAGYAPLTDGATEATIALYAGAAMNTYLLNHVYPNRHRLDPQDSLEVLTLSSMGGFQLSIANDKDYLPTRVSYKLNLTGASVNVQTACSTSLVAIHLAAQDLLQGGCDLALAGGVSVHTPQTVGHLYQDGMILTPDGHCRAFDAQAEGTIFGSGAGIVVLKRLEEAIADRDQIYAVIKGSAVGNDGGMKVGYLAPQVEGQARVISEAMAMADFAADSVTYVEAHGTGTKLGDPIELAALMQAFQTERVLAQRCAVGSVKTNVGHLNVASGVVGFIKTVLALHHQKLPPSLHFNTPNPQIDFAHSPFFVNTTLQDWTTDALPRRAGVNALGIGGTNVHVCLEAAPPQPTLLPKQERPLHLLTLSAKTPIALQELADRYGEFLTTHADLSIADLCFTANVGRSLFPHRLAIVADSTAALRAQLQAAQSNIQSHIQSNIRSVATSPPLAMLFTGQGSQYPQMGRQLYETQPVFQQAIDRCDQVLRSDLDPGISLRHLLYDDSSSNAERLQQTAYAQPALFAVEYALFELWKSWGVQPNVVMGHSLGEYVAAYVAGVLSLEDALKLVVYRGRLMQALPPGKMVAVWSNADRVNTLLRQNQLQVSIAAINSEHNVVISGDPASIQQAMLQLHQQGIQTKSLSVSHAFHSPLMASILPEFRSIASTISYASPTIPLISNVTGTVADGTIATADYWCQQLQKPVQFATGLQQLQQLGCEVVLECGAKPTLSSIGRSAQPDVLWLPSLHPNQADWSSMLSSLKELYLRGLAIDWAGFDRPYLRRRLSLPTYPFQRQRYWLDARPDIKPNAKPNVELNAKPNIQQDVKPASLSLVPLTNHPLLGQKIATPKATIFNASVTLEALPFLHDHRICGAIVLPGSAYLEMALAAGTELRSSGLRTEVTPLPIGLEHLHIHQAMVWSDLSPSDAPQSLQISLTAESTRFLFEIYSCKTESSQWILHCTGTIAPVVDAIIPDFLQLKQEFSSDQILKDFWTDILTARSGLEYGAAFRGVQRVWRNQQAALGQIHLPECLQSQKSSYQIHPALLDAGLQLALLFAPDQTKSYIPISLDRLQYFAPPSDRLWSYVRVKLATPEVIITDVDLFTEAGQCVLTIAGLTAKAVSAPALGLAPAWKNWLHTLEWQPAPLPPQSKVQSPGQWLIFVDAQGMGRQLAQKLADQHHSCTIVVSNSTAQGSGLERSINPLEVSQFDALLQSLNWRDAAYQGVLYFWNLDATTIEQTVDAYTGALHLLQALIHSGSQVPVWFVTQASQSLNIQPVGLAQAPLWALGKTMLLEHPQLPCHWIDVGLDQAGKDGDRSALVDRLVEEIQVGAATQVAYHAGIRHVAQLTAASIAQPNDLEMLQLQMLQRGSCEQLVWQSVNRRSPAEDEIELRVLATGLNFRDVLNVLGRYPGDAGALGLECVGEVVAIGAQVQALAVGDVVLAVAPACFGQFVITKATLAVLKPPSLSIAAAATLPTAFLTAHYALRVIANLQPGDRILIHAAAGGVGLAAVQIAQQVGAEIFATASPHKWLCLQQRGITHLYSSRSLDFVEAIRSETNGQGVDVVLNSLSGEFMLKSAALVRSGGRFIEIGKPDPAELLHLRQLHPDIHTALVDLMAVTSQDPDQIQSLFRQVMEQIQHAQLQPLPYTLFHRDQVVDAFRYMQQARQIGKVVVEIAKPQFRICQEGIYLITGGLGGLGLQVAQALVDWGAKHLLLIGRTAPPLAVEQRLQQWQQEGVEVMAAPLDIADAEAVSHWFRTAHPTVIQRLRGVFHAAGVLDDGVIENQTRERFERVMASKIRGAWNLHQLTQNCAIDCFVLFSSAASLLGSAGQANYAAANAGLDALAHLRHSLGLPVLSINWGAWDSIGMTVRHRPQSQVALPASIAPEIGIDILKTLLSQGFSQVGVLPFVHSAASNSAASIEKSTERLAQKPASPWIEQLLALPESDRCHELLDRLRHLIAKILGVEPSQIDPEQGFTDLGLDSLTLVELKHQLQQQLDCSLPVTLLYTHATLTALTDHLMHSLNLSSEPINPIEPTLIAQNNSTQNHVSQNEIDSLSDDEAEALLLTELDRLNL